MRLSIFIVMLAALALVGCAALSSEVPLQTNNPSPSAYPDLGAAPELTNQTWLNTSGPLRLADLRGKVVLIDMWTFG